MSHPLREQAHSYSHSSVSACGVAMFDESALAREGVDAGDRSVKFAGQFAGKRALINRLYTAEAQADDDCRSALAREGAGAGDKNPSNSPTSSRTSALLQTGSSRKSSGDPWGLFKTHALAGNAR